MPRQIASSVENNFRQGLITEASGLNFPENACTETYDCVFNLDGSVDRRLGFDFEEDFTTKSINRTDVVVNNYLWKNVAGDGNTTLLVLQVGGTLYFYETNSVAISTGAVSSTVALSSFSASGAPAPDTVECQFSSGTKYLIVTHPYCEPFFVSYDTATQTAAATQITLKIRDFAGDTADGAAVDERPTATVATMNVHHHYNLLNQGWNATNLAAWDTSQTTVPSNVDIMWSFKNASDAFDMTTLNNVMHGNSPAPKGHFILTLSNQDRDTASGLSGTTATTTSYQRPSTSAWFAGRVFYSGINYANFNSNIYFTQILERDEQYGFCYQANDPTAEDVFDLLPSDGGVLSIKEAGTIYKLVSIAGALIIFANNGIWTVTGSTGIGFTATDYTIQKISSINAISASSFVDVGGVPCWWNAEGIYIITMQNGVPVPKSLTLTTIKSFYDDIPQASKLAAKGYYHTVSGVIQWLFRSTVASGPTETYTYDRILNFNTTTGAFYPWIIPNTAVTVNGIIVLDGSRGIISQLDIIDDSSNTIVDDSGNTIVAFQFTSTSGGATPAFKFIVSYVDAGSYKFTLAENKSEDYLDWQSYSAGTGFISYFISGFKLHGQGIRKFQTNYLTVFSNTNKFEHVHATVTHRSVYYFQPMWDYATSGNTGRWGSRQYVAHTDANYSDGMRKLKIRGSGRALQFKVTSVDEEPFSIIGWVGWESANVTP